MCYVSMGKACVSNVASDKGYSEVVMISISTRCKCRDINSNWASAPSFSVLCNPLLISPVICFYVGMTVKLFWITAILHWKKNIPMNIQNLSKTSTNSLWHREYNFIIQSPPTYFGNICGHLQGGKCNNRNICIMYWDHLKLRIFWLWIDRDIL